MATRRSFFARRLQTLREAERLSPVALAHRAGLTAVALARLEAGRRDPDWETVCHLARALRVSVAAFTDGPTALAANGDPLKAVAPRLWKAAQAYARAYDQLEKKSRSPSGESVELFSRFQEAQVELNLAALDQFSGQSVPNAKSRTGRGRRTPAAR
jgi:transcriptional regulator with XRE-family HTH domain